jgi:hypothetical protein
VAATRQLDRVLAEAREITDRRFAPPSLEQPAERNRVKARRKRRS